jgi:colicin import membrane protein
MIGRHANEFPFYLRRSFYIHSGLLALTLIGGKIAIEQHRLIAIKNMQLIEASVRVDVVAMPKLTINELKNMSSGADDAAKEVASDLSKSTEKEISKVDNKNEDNAVKVDNSESLLQAEKEKKRKDFLGKLKSLSKKSIDGNGDQKNVEKGANGEKSSALKELVLQGNKLSSGTAIYGSGNSEGLTAFQMYVSKLPDRVRPHWRLPSFLLDKKLKCRIRVWLNNDGELTHSEVYQSSGEPEYDQRAIEAIRSAKFPPIKDEFEKRASNGDIVLGFPL